MHFDNFTFCSGSVTEYQATSQADDLSPQNIEIDLSSNYEIKEDH